MNPHECRRMFEAWAQWMHEGGWDYVEVDQSPFARVARNPGEHSDPTLARLVKMEHAKDLMHATTHEFYSGLPKLQRALVFETYVQPLHDKEPLNVRKIQQAWGISPRVYYDQMRLTMVEFGKFLDQRKVLAA